MQVFFPSFFRQKTNKLNLLKPSLTPSLDVEHTCPLFHSVTGAIKISVTPVLSRAAPSGQKKSPIPPPANLSAESVSFLFARRFTWKADDGHITSWTCVWVCVCVCEWLSADSVAFWANFVIHIVSVKRCRGGENGRRTGPFGNSVTFNDVAMWHKNTLPPSDLSCSCWKFCPFPPCWRTSTAKSALLK